VNKLVVASSNPGKLAELRGLLVPLGTQIVAQAELGIADAEEPHFTFLENALAKARHASDAAGLPALADDSGICVTALGGEPGVNSAYFAGTEGTREERDARNNAKLLGLLSGNTNRSARYVCVVVLVRHARDPLPVVAQGEWAGEIAAEPRGANGFGYDPYFLLPTLGKTAAELDSGDKNRLSHRAKALHQLVTQLREVR
jgi:XTP/dITP diphosphohydrolase